MTTNHAVPSATRVIGVTRVSERGDREGDRLKSPGVQRKLIEDYCEREGWVLLDVFEEMDVSGKRPLAKRPGMSVAINAIEAGEADVVMVGYFDRLVRSLRVQEEIITRVEKVNGRIRALDFGEISHKTTASWLSATNVGMMNEYFTRIVAEKVKPAHAAAVAAGIPPFSVRIPGYRRDEKSRRLVVVEAEKLAVQEAYDLRLAGQSVKQICARLNERDIDITYNRTRTLLATRIVLGEIHFGEHVNLKAHEAIVDVDIFEAAQKMTVKRGRQAKSERLLARLDVLHCDHCGGRMTVNADVQRGYPFYRCGNRACTNRVTIAAGAIEDHVVGEVERWLKNGEGRASTAGQAARAAERVEVLESRVKRLARIARISDDEESIEDLGAAKAELAEAEVEAERLRRIGRLKIVRVEDFRRASLIERRGLIRDVVETVRVRPGRADVATRAAVSFFREFLGE